MQLIIPLSCVMREGGREWWLCAVEGACVCACLCVSVRDMRTTEELAEGWSS